MLLEQLRSVRSSSETTLERVLSSSITRSKRNERKNRDLTRDLERLNCWTVRRNYTTPHKTQMIDTTNLTGQNTQISPALP